MTEKERLIRDNEEILRKVKKDVEELDKRALDIHRKITLLL